MSLSFLPFSLILQHSLLYLLIIMSFPNTFYPSQFFSSLGPSAPFFFFFCLGLGHGRNQVGSAEKSPPTIFLRKGPQRF